MLINIKILILETFARVGCPEFHPVFSTHSHHNFLILSLSKDALESENIDTQCVVFLGLSPMPSTLERILRQAQDEERVEEYNGKDRVEFCQTHPRKGLQDEHVEGG